MSAQPLAPSVKHLSTCRLVTGLAMLVTLVIGGAVSADQNQTPAMQSLADNLFINGQQLPVARVTKTPIDNLYAVHLESGEVLYSDAQGSHFVVGDLYRNAPEGTVNLTEGSRSEERAQRLEDVADSERVVFEGLGETRAEVVVFTDPSCPYCLRFHETVPELNAQGVGVHYMAFPREGMDSNAARVMQQTWCASNRVTAMNQAKAGEALEASPDCDNPVAEQYRLGAALGVRGTPAIVLPDGELIGGFVPVDTLMTRLGLDKR